MTDTPRTKEIRFTFEVLEQGDIPVHELLCLAIHEGNVKALNELRRVVVDIQEQEQGS